MGIDVSGVFQRREGGQWSYVGDYHDGRRGELRSWLGWGNGSWWQGTIEPIAPLRGLPLDFDLSELDPRRSEHGITVEMHIGTRSRSWLHADEILNALPALAVRQLSVPHAIYLQTADMTSNLAQWQAATGLCREVDAWPLVQATYQHPDAGNSADVRVDCVCDFSGEVQYFVDELQQLRAQHGEVRFVYGFA